METFTQIILKRFLRNRLAVIGGIGVITMFIFGILGKAGITPYKYTEISAQNRLQPPSTRYILGTDKFGRCVFSRMMRGAWVSLLVGFVSVGISVVIGTILGSLAGFYGGIVDMLISRFIDVMLCFPTFFLILTLVAVIPTSTAFPPIFLVMIVIGFTSWMGVARLVRGEFIALREREFVLAATGLGASNARIIFKHILPNAIGPVLVNATLAIATAILTEAALSFLGLGVQAPEPTWGNMLTESKDIMEHAWWMSIFPGLAIFLTVMSYNLLGEGLRDAVDPLS
ncbi:ABC transporter permease [Candidatus Riflebacteria bacterium]